MGVTLAGFSEERQKQIVRDYKNLTLTTDEVMRRHKIGSERLMLILDKFKVPRRGPRAFGRFKRTAAQVFLGMQKAKATAKSDTLEQAKLALRRRGCIVYDADVTEGPKARGLIRVDNKRLTHAEVIQAAAVRVPR